VFLLVDIRRVADLDVLKHWYRSATGTLDKILEACHAVLKEHRDIYERMRPSIQGNGDGEVR
jgi:hypothetical protein